MLAAPNRLRKPHEITRVYKRGVYGAGGGDLSVKASSTGLAESRAVVVVSKKVSKRAVVRNRIRRRLAGVLAEGWTTVTPGYDIVISVHTDISRMPAADLRLRLMTALKRCRVITQ